MAAVGRLPARTWRARAASRKFVVKVEFLNLQLRASFDEDSAESR
jgi:hypothetical protein